MGNNSDRSTWNKFLYFSTFVANLSSFSLGTTYAWSSPGIPRLNGLIDPEDNPLRRNITPNEEAWIASLVPLGAAISAPICGYLSDRIGRKWTLLAFSIPMFLGYVFLTFGNEIVYFYIGRFLCGFATGPSFVITPIYIGEIAESTNRGTLGCIQVFLITIGGLYVYLSALGVSLTVISATNLAIPVIFSILFGVFVPESPYYYIAKNRVDLAEEALLKLRSNNVKAVREELHLIISYVRESFKKKLSLEEMVQDRTISKGFAIAAGLMFFQQWTGVKATLFYLQTIFEETNSTIPSEYCAIIAGFVQVIASVVAIQTIDKFGRRVLLLVSAICNALSLLMTGTYFILKQYTQVPVDNINWLPVVTVNVFIFAYTAGFGPVGFTMIGELFSPYVKSFAATVNIEICLICIFCGSNVFSYLKESAGIGVPFCLFGFICCFGVIFIYFKVPETKGKRLEEIQKIL